MLKIWTEWRAGPASASPWRTKRETRLKLSQLCGGTCVAVEGGTLRRKNKVSKKISQCRKTERETLWDFKHPNCCKISKKLKGRPFEEKKVLGKKSHDAEKLRGGTFWGFSTSILSQNIKKLKGKNF